MDVAVTVQVIYDALLRLIYHELLRFIHDELLRLVTSPVSVQVWLGGVTFTTLTLVRSLRFFSVGPMPCARYDDPFLVSPLMSVEMGSGRVSLPTRTRVGFLLPRSFCRGLFYRVVSKILNLEGLYGVGLHVLGQMGPAAEDPPAVTYERLVAFFLSIYVRSLMSVEMRAVCVTLPTSADVRLQATFFRFRLQTGQGTGLAGLLMSVEVRSGEIALPAVARKRPSAFSLCGLHPTRLNAWTTTHLSFLVSAEMGVVGVAFTACTSIQL